MSVKAVARAQTNALPKKQPYSLKSNLLKMLAIYVPTCLLAAMFDYRNTLWNALWAQPLRSPMDALDSALQNHSFATSEIGQTLAELKKAGKISNDNFFAWNDTFFDAACSSDPGNCRAVFHPDNLSHPVVWGWTSGDNAFVSAQYTTGNKTNNCTLTLFQTLSGTDQFIEPDICTLCPLDTSDDPWVYNLSRFFLKAPEDHETGKGARLEVVEDESNPSEQAHVADKPEDVQAAEQSNVANKPKDVQLGEQANPADKPEDVQLGVQANVADKPEDVQLGEQANVANTPEKVQHGVPAKADEKPKDVQPVVQVNVADKPKDVQPVVQVNVADKPKDVQPVVQVNVADKSENAKPVANSNAARQPLDMVSRVNTGDELEKGSKSGESPRMSISEHLVNLSQNKNPRQKF